MFLKKKKWTGWGRREISTCASERHMEKGGRRQVHQWQEQDRFEQRDTMWPSRELHSHLPTAIQWRTMLYKAQTSGSAGLMYFISNDTDGSIAPGLISLVWSRCGTLERTAQTPHTLQVEPATPSKKSKALKIKFNRTRCKKSCKMTITPLSGFRFRQNIH